MKGENAKNRIFRWVTNTDSQRRTSFEESARKQITLVQPQQEETSLKRPTKEDRKERGIQTQDIKIAQKSI